MLYARVSRWGPSRLWNVTLFHFSSSTPSSKQVTIWVGCGKKNRHSQFFLKQVWQWVAECSFHFRFISILRHWKSLNRGLSCNVVHSPEWRSKSDANLYAATSRCSCFRGKLTASQS